MQMRRNGAGLERTIGALLAAGSLACAVAQQPAATDPLRRGQLVVWVIHPETVERPKMTTVPEVHAPEPGYHEVTPSGLGQTASSYGQTAGRYGIDSDSPILSTPPSGQVTNAAGRSQTLAPGYREATPSTLGTASAAEGTDASSYGQTAGSYGTSASNIGQTAGSYGQTAGSFGHSLSTIAGAGQPPPVIPPPPPLRETVEPALRAENPALRVQFVEGDAGKLRNALRNADAAHTSPDVLIFEGFPANWAGPAAEVRALEATSAGGYAPASAAGGYVSAQAVVLRKAPHPRQAQAFLTYLEEKGALSNK
jgi:hypothetical protein